MDRHRHVRAQILVAFGPRNGAKRSPLPQSLGGSKGSKLLRFRAFALGGRRGCIPSHGRRHLRPLKALQPLGVPSHNNASVSGRVAFGWGRLGRWVDVFEELWGRGPFSLTRHVVAGWVRRLSGSTRQQENGAGSKFVLRQSVKRTGDFLSGLPSWSEHQERLRLTPSVNWWRGG